MDFERYSDNAIDVFNDIANIPGMKEQIFLEFPEYVYDSDIENIIKKIKNVDNILESESLKQQYFQLKDNFSIDKIIEEIASYFSESKLAEFVEYLVYMFDI